MDAPRDASSSVAPVRISADTDNHASPATRVPKLYVRIAFPLFVLLHTVYFSSHNHLLHLRTRCSNVQMTTPVSTSAIPTPSLKVFWTGPYTSPKHATGPRTRLVTTCMSTCTLRTPLTVMSIQHAPSTQEHYWHIAHVLKSDITVHNEKELRVLVKDAKRSYFVQANYERTYQYLKRVGAIQKAGRVLRWKECNLTPSNMEFLNRKGT